MLVGLDGRGLSAAARSGVERYVVELARALAQLDDRPDMLAYTDGPIPDADLSRALSGRLETRLIAARRGWLRVALPWRLWRDRVDLVHLPSTILPPLLPCPAVVTVHDLAWRKHPETYAPDDLAMQSRAASGVRRAAHVIAVSETTARDVMDLLGIPRDKITVTPLAVSAQFSPEGARVPAGAFEGAERLAEGYVLYAGGLAPRKNLVRLLEAYQQVARETQAPPLVLPGADSPHARELRRRAAELGLQDRVIFPGYVEEALLPALYRGATVFVYPSLYEGFGMAVLEAMASGLPVITSDRSGTAEAAADAALLVSPESVEEIASALARLLGDEQLRSDLAARGLRRSKACDWRQTARQTIAAYGRAVRGA